MLCLAIDFKVIAECGCEGHISSGETENTIREFELLEQTFHVCQHLFVRSVGMLRRVNTHDLDLRELMQTVQATYILAVRTCLATETLRISAVLNRQLVLVDDHIAVDIRYRHLSGRDEIEVIHLAVVHLALFVGQLTRSVPRSSVHYGRRHDLRVTGFVCLGEEEIDERTLETSTLTDINRETCARDLHTEVEVNEVVFLSEIPVREFGIV